jgi:hypothetical protein
MTQPATITTVGGASPFRFPTIWDSLSLGGGAYTWHGPVKFRSARRNFDWQFKRAPGVKGDTNTFRGTHAHPFEMIVRVWTDAMWSELPNLLSFFNYDGTKTGPDGLPLVSPIDIYHPALSFVNIGQVLCEWIEVPEFREEREGDVLVRFGLHEYLPAIATTNVTTTPAATQTPIGVNSEITAGSATTSAVLPSQKAAIASEANVLGTLKGLP